MSQFGSSFYACSLANELNFCAMTTIKSLQYRVYTKNESLYKISNYKFRHGNYITLKHQKWNNESLHKLFFKNSLLYQNQGLDNKNKWSLKDYI